MNEKDKFVEKLKKYKKDDIFITDHAKEHTVCTVIKINRRWQHAVEKAAKM